MTSYSFRPAKTFRERHGLFVALVGAPNSGKTYSAIRLARGIAGDGKIAVLDTEGGRTLHLKEKFDFDVMVMPPPHRPSRYLEAAEAAQAAGYGCLVIDSFSMEWRGVGGVLDWTDSELEESLARAKTQAENRGYQFDETRARNAHKASASIRPKMAHKLMIAGMLGMRMPIIFAIRGEMTFDPDTKKEKFKAQVQQNFLFEVTVSFRLSMEKKGVVDLSDPSAWKMEGEHAKIFSDGDLLSEEHGAALRAWSTGGMEAPKDEKEVGLPIVTLDRGVISAPDADRWVSMWHAAIQARQQKKDIDGIKSLRTKNQSTFRALEAIIPEAVMQITTILDAATIGPVGEEE